MAINTVTFLRAVAGSGLPRGLRDMLRALLTWADYGSWECWPSVGTIAEAMGVDRRTVQRWLTELRSQDLLTDIGVMPAGQFRLRINVEKLLSIGGTDSAADRGRRDVAGGRQDAAGGATPRHRGGGIVAAGGRHDAAQTDQRTNQRTNQSTTAAVASILGSDELLTHPNATPERLAWIAREAPKKNNPAGWAAGAIREGYKPAPPTDSERSAESRKIRDELLRRFDRLSGTEQLEIRNRALNAYPILNPANKAHQASIRGAIAKVMAEIDEYGGGSLSLDQGYSTPEGR